MEPRVRVLGLLLVWWSAFGPAPAQVRHPLPVLWMMPISSGSGMENLTAALVPAVDLALQDLQRQPAPLGNYEIQVQLLDSQCDPAASLKALFDAMWAGPRYLLLLGGVCPSVTTLVARALPALRLVQVSFTPSPPAASNRKWYGNLFSTAPSDRALNQATVKLLQRFKWKRVGVVTQRRPRLLEMRKDLMKQLAKADVQVVSAESFSEDVCSSLRKLKERDVRIIVGQFEDDSASDVFCCAYRLDLFGPRLQWLLADGAAGGWSFSRRFSSGCSADVLLTAADGSMRLQMRTIGGSSSPGVSGRTPQDYQDAYLQLVGQGSEVNPLHGFAYDAVWVVATAMVQVTEAEKHREKFGLHRNRSVTDDDAHRALLEAVKKTQLQGVTGPVQFRGGERTTILDLVQFQGGGGVAVGEFSTSTQQLRLKTHLLRFKGPGPARDRTLVLLQRRHVSLQLYAAVASAAALAILITLAVAVFSAVHREPCRSQDQLLLLSILLTSSSVLVSGLDGASLSSWTSEVLCSVRLWTLSVGHTVGFAVLFTKTWRLYSLCSGMPKRQNHEQRGGCMALWIFLLDVSVLTSWQVLDPLRWVVQQHDSGAATATRSGDEDVVVRPFSEHCSSDNTELWLTAVYGYKGPLLGLGCFLAWSLRAVKVDRSAVSGQHLAATVFAVTLFSVSGATAALLMSHNPPVLFCLTSGFILCCNALTLSFLFGPKFVHVWRKSSELQSEAADDEDEEPLMKRNQQLKGQSAQLDVQIETISSLLSDCEPAEETKLGHETSTHVAQICSEESSEGINHQDKVWRRLSVQLPILHHSYLPAVGGVSSSRSSLEAFVHLDL
ncbi:uncharacterized protein V6R79_002151 [Siganus canaliculatus]